MFDLEDTIETNLQKTVISPDEVEYTNNEDILIARAVRVEEDGWVLAFNENEDFFPEHILVGVVGGHRAYNTENECRLAAELVYSINR